MATRKTRVSLDSDRYISHPAQTAESREDQLIALATDLVEKRLLEGTASSAETVHFLKRGSMKERLELEKMREEMKLLRAKTEELQSAKRSEDLYRDAIKAFGLYSGQVSVEDDDSDEQD